MSRALITATANTCCDSDAVPTGSRTSLLGSLGARHHMLLTRERDEEERLGQLTEMHGLGAVLLGLSISLDELAIGFTLGLLRLPAGLVIVLIALQVFIVAQLGLRLGSRLSERAERLAGEVEEELQLRCDVPEPIRRSEGDAVRPLETEVTAVAGDGRLEAITLNAGEELPADALIVSIGGTPRTHWAAEQNLVIDEGGYLVTGHDLFEHGRPPRSWGPERLPLALEASVPGVFVAGDIRRGSIKRVASAVGEGATAVGLIHRYLSRTGD